MKRTVFWALVAVNVVLLAALVAPYLHGNSALAQRPGAGRRPELLMIPGEISGGNSAVVYLVDTANRRLGAVSLNNKGNGLDSLAPQDLTRIFEDRDTGGAGKAGPGGREKMKGGR
jgi:hypothetical protein